MKYKYTEAIADVTWSRLKWDLSWSEKVKLDDLLPETGRSYLLPNTTNGFILEDGQMFFEWQSPYSRYSNYIKKGEAYFIWKPPQSELCGWSDNRPYEITKSYVIKGNVIEEHASNDKKYASYLEVCVTDRIKLFDFFECQNSSTLSDFLSIRKADRIEDNWGAKLAHLDKYMYLSFSGHHEDRFDIICSRESRRLYMHYFEEWCTFKSTLCVIKKYRLIDKAEHTIETLIEKADKMPGKWSSELREDEVLGAEYQ